LSRQEVATSCRTGRTKSRQPGSSRRADPRSRHSPADESRCRPGEESGQGEEGRADELGHPELGRGDAGDRRRSRDGRRTAEACSAVRGEPRGQRW